MWNNRVRVEGGSADVGGDFADTLQRTLGNLARSTQDIQVSVNWQMSEY